MTLPSVTPAGQAVAEVVVRHQGRIVDVQHIRWSELPALSPTALIAGGGLAVLFGLALALYSAAAAEISTWTTTGASIGLLLLALGVVPLVLGLMRARDPARTRYTIGEAPGVDFTVALPAPAGDGLPLVIALERGFVLGLPPGARGTIDGPAPVDLADALTQGRRSLALPEGASASVELGALTFEIHQVPPPEPVRAPLELDRLTWLSHVAAALLLGGWFVYLGRAPATALELDVREQFERVVKLVSHIPSPPDPPVPPPEVAPARTATTPPQAPPAPPAPEPPPAPEFAVDPDSERVAPTSPNAFVRRHKHGTGRTDSEFDYDRVAGHLGDPGFVGAVDDYTVNMKRGQLAYKITPEVDAWWAAATGGPPRTAKHFGGLELAETERGGGVHHDKPASPKKPVSTVTLTAGDGKLPTPTPEEEARIRRLTTIEMDPPSLDADAGLDRGNLHRYARDRMPAWRTCYENALDKNPDLAGVVKLVVRFDAKGAVTRSYIDYTTRNIDAITPCLLAAVNKWKPAPTMPRPTTAVFHLQFSARTK